MRYARLSEDGKSINCLLCGKSPKLDKCKRCPEGHITYFNRVHGCTTKTTNLETSQAKIKDHAGAKRPLKSVTKTWCTNFLISNHQIYHLKEHD